MPYWICINFLSGEVVFDLHYYLKDLCTMICPYIASIQVEIMGSGIC